MSFGQPGGYQRNSNFELFRIILMFLIIAHHYTVNSGLTELYDFNEITGNMIFLQIFGMFGKTAINCFTLITGYFMINSHLSVIKVLKMYLEVKFYYFLFYIVFLLTGYEVFSFKGLIKTAFSVVYESGNLYTGTLIVFYLSIPFINILAKGLTKRQHQALLALLIVYFTVFSTFFKHETFDFIGWMMAMYLIGGYISLYKDKVFDNRAYAFIGLAISVIFMISSILVIDFVGSRFDVKAYYYFLSDSHKFLALSCSLSAFLVFKNVHIRRSKLINTVAASTFGVLLIHTNSNSMRSFLWRNLFHNTSFYGSNYLFLHAFCAVIGTYIVCFLIDIIRIKLIEEPLFNRIMQLKWIKTATRAVSETQ